MTQHSKLKTQNSHKTLIVFAREPIPGRTKTRLCPPLDGATAAALYACFLRDTIDLARRIAGARALIAYTPESDAGFFARLALDLAARPQRGMGLGERMDNAFADTFAPSTDHRPPTAEDSELKIEDSNVGAGETLSSILNPRSSNLSSVVIIGTDSPNLPTDYLHAAFARLDDGADLVLGPADDGGYYLIGLRARQPRLLREAPMSTPTLLADTLAIAAELGLRAELLPMWYDVDTAAELKRLAEDLRDTPADIAPHTRAFIANCKLQIADSSATL
jgi:glycosyltransferase A (GT-A) superfamily protein (DUF2064 family)